MALLYDKQACPYTSPTNLPTNQATYQPTNPPTYKYMEACLIMPVLYSPSNQLPNNQPTYLPLIHPNGYDILNIEHCELIPLHYSAVATCV